MLRLVQPAPLVYGAPVEPISRHARLWFSWILGAAAVTGVVAIALRFAEGQAFLRIAQRAEPSWLIAAVLLQAATYLAEALGWRWVARAARFPLPLATAYKLSLAKLFIDQALPSGGISGTVVFAHALEERGMPRPAVTAGVVVDVAAYYATYVVCLAAAVLVSLLRREANMLVALVSTAFAVFAIALVVAFLTLSGRRAGALTKWLSQVRPIRSALKFLEDADPRLARSPRLLVISAVCQLAIFVLDAATVWVLIRASGVSASAPGVFASFMISTLFRTVGFVPGGLGTFEATSVLTLHLIGVDVAVALSATLLFRGLSFWLPMLPGLWFSRGAVPRSATNRPDSRIPT